VGLGDGVPHEEHESGEGEKKGSMKARRPAAGCAKHARAALRPIVPGDKKGTSEHTCVERKSQVRLTLAFLPLLHVDPCETEVT